MIYIVLIFSNVKANYWTALSERLQTASMRIRWSDNLSFDTNHLLVLRVLTDILLKRHLVMYSF